MSSYYNVPADVVSGTRARSSKINDLIDSITEGFNNVEANMDSFVRWSIVASNTTAVNKTGYLVDCSVGPVTITLPYNPSEGDTISIMDYKETAGTNSIIVDRNGSNIEGSGSNYTISTVGSGLYFVYTDASTGWKIVLANNAVSLINDSLTNGNTMTAPSENAVYDALTSHASNHTDGTDDIQSATNSQKGLATSSHITAVEANTTHSSSNGTDHTYIDQDVTSGASPNFDGANFTGVFPSGGIIMWSGSIASIPSGWYLCDGNNGTPNLTDRFVIHADGSTNAVGDIGGSNTIAESQLPSHSHSDGTLATGSDSHSHGDGTLATNGDSHSHGDGSLSTNTTGSHNHSVTQYYGDGNRGQFGEGGSATDPATAYTNSNGSHSHSVSGNTDTDTHSHDVTGGTDTDTHSHDVSGSTSSTGSGSDFKPKYYALAYIMKG